MKRHTKFAVIVCCCAATFSLLSSKAATIQVQVGAGGLKFTPQDVTIHVGDTVEWTVGWQHPQLDLRNAGESRWVMDSGVQNIGFVFSHTFTTAGDLELPAGRAFDAIYRAFLGRTNGPRAGWLLASLDPDFVATRLREAAMEGATA